MTYLEALQNAIEQSANCKAKYLRTEPVKEEFQCKTAWEGKVEIFELIGHPKTNRAYGWGFQEGKKAEFSVIIGIPPVTSPEMAVKAFVLNKSKSR